ncbi:MAG: DegV family protein [Bulleidia sp.]
MFAEINREYPGCHIIYMAYSAVTTCSYQSAVIAGENFNNISYIDTRHVTVGQCAAVIRFAQELQKHPEWTVQQAEQAATEISRSVAMSFIPGSLDYLRAGGVSATSQPSAATC